MADHPIPVSHGVVVKDLAKKIDISKKHGAKCVFFRQRCKKVLFIYCEGLTFHFYGSNLSTYDPFEF